ncbi:hypothetical protein [Martelella alba]|uniref:hypothetical protein n=1 Tax=Martelella alba TaxID=2590451 RepID=UPI0018AD3D0D|nr:hypothetical protein [Martelella alba]
MDIDSWLSSQNPDDLRSLALKLLADPRPAGVTRCLSSLRKPSLIQTSHQYYINPEFYKGMADTEKTQSHDEELLTLYNARDIPRFMEKCVEHSKTLAVAVETSTQ